MIFPLLELDPPGINASHSVNAPGGYEWWYFDAVDLAHYRQLVVIVFDGCIFHPGYLRADGRYRRDPTRVPPVVPRDYPCLYFALYENGRVRRQFLKRYRSGQLSARRDRLHVTIGDNAIASVGESIELTLAAPINATLRFAPRSALPIARRRFVSRELAGSDHYWLSDGPLCDVSGSLELDGETIRFRGRGYHDHQFGAAALGGGLRRWMRGRLLLDDSAAVFHLIEPSDSSRPAELTALQTHCSTVQETTLVQRPSVVELRTSGGLRYPTTVVFSDSLKLWQPRVIDATPFYSRVQYQAQLADQSGHAVTDWIYPNRLRSLLLGRWIERKILT